MKVFVYGTLRHGGRFHYLLESADYLGYIELPGFALYDLGGDVPGVVPASLEHKLFVECYDVPEQLFEQIEVLEYGYKAAVVIYEARTGKKIEGTIFLWPDITKPYVGTAPPTLVPSGDWMER